jgi:hypothetical protein
MSAPFSTPSISVLAFAFFLVVINPCYAAVGFVNIDFNGQGLQGGSSPTFAGFDVLDPSAPNVDRVSNASDYPLDDYWNGVDPGTAAPALMLSDGRTFTGVQLSYDPLPTIANQITPSIPSNAIELMQDSLRATEVPQVLLISGLKPGFKYLLYLYGSVEQAAVGTQFTISAVDGTSVSNTSGLDPLTADLTLKEDYIARTAFADLAGRISISYAGIDGEGGFNGLQIFGSFPDLPLQSIFTTQEPVASNATDGVEYELGTRFQAATNGSIYAIRYWNSLSEQGTHRGSIWRWSDGSLLAVVSRASIADPEGWVELPLDSPLPIEAGVTYVVSANSRSYFPMTSEGLSTPVMNGDLTTIADGNNGLFGEPFEMPARTYSNSNYFRDVVFLPE